VVNLVDDLKYPSTLRILSSRWSNTRGRPTSLQCDLQPSKNRDI